MRPVESIAATAGGGDRGETLRALRDRLAAEIDRTTSAREVAALSQRLMDVLEQLDMLSKGKTGRTPLDEFSRRLAERKPAARGAAGAARTS